MKKFLNFSLLFFSFITLCSFKTNYSILEYNKKFYPDFYDEKNIYNAPTNPVFLINKFFYLEQNYVPLNLVEVGIDYIKREEIMLIDKEVNENLIELQNELRMSITVFSAYRSYEKQLSLYSINNDLLTAKPGFSEHQTGLAIDISQRDIGLIDDLEYSLLYKEINKLCYKYGFILRYPKNKEHITGYSFEPWHYRYVGKDIAEIIYNENITLEEYFYKYVPLSY